MTAELRSINSGPIRRALDRTAKLFEQIGAGDGGDKVSLVIDPAYAGPRREGGTTGTTTTAWIASFSNMLFRGKEGLTVENSGIVRMFGTSTAMPSVEPFQWLTVPANHATETWIASLSGGKFQVGDAVMGLHPVHNLWGLWSNSSPGGASYWVMRGSGGDLYLNCASAATVCLRGANADMLRVSAGQTFATGQIQTGHDAPNPQFANAQLFANCSQAGQQARVALNSPGVCPQMRGLAADGEQLVAVNNQASGYCPVGASAFNTLSTQTIKRDIRTLRPERERIFVHHDVRSEVVPDIDIMALRPVAFRPKVPALRIVPTNGDSYDANDPDSWESVPEVGILGHEGTRERLGLIAEEVETVIPSAVTHNCDGDTRGIDYAQITVALLDHVQRLTDEVATLRYRIAELEAAS